MAEEKNNGDDGIIYARVGSEVKDAAEAKRKAVGIGSTNTLITLLLRQWVDGKIKLEV